MNKKLLIGLLLVLGIILNDSMNNPVASNITGAPAGRTGSPGDNNMTCAISGCHNSFPLQFRGNLISSNIPEEGYTPGETYTVTASIVSPDRNRFGFQVSPQNADGTKLGTMIITDAASMQLLSSGKYITHKSGVGVTGTGGKTWSFDWTAPATGTGDVTFYGAFNIANANGNTLGDTIVRTEFVVTEKQETNSVISKHYNPEIKAYPNPFDRETIVEFGKTLYNAQLEVYDMRGKLLKSYTGIYAGSFTLTKDDLSPGLYLVKVSTNSELMNARVIVK